MNFEKLSFDLDSGVLLVVIETPKGSRNKFDWDFECGAFKLGGVLTAGASFPYDFGFAPGTLGEDGDPLDVLVLMDEPAFPGCLVEVRIIGVIEAEQTERDGSEMRNDRFIAVAQSSHLFCDVHSFDDLASNLIDEIEHFFVSYNAIKGKEFKLLARGDVARATQLLMEGAAQKPEEKAGKAKSAKQNEDKAAKETTEPAMNTLFEEEAKPKPRTPNPITQIWCDGACSGNPGVGGWGTIVEENGERRELSGSRARATNNQMELQALIEGLKSIAPGTRVEIVTDSEYVSKGISSWLKGWIRNGWKTASKAPVKNQEQWQELNDLLQARPHKVSWVRGHAGHAENERCDELARAAIKKIV